ncbi:MULTISPECIES: FecR domain-containing protein [unclassified Achromobacter]|uniref:FecR family protein n=1 Tax=unclassified Achromobacter TaxID=2626865 RepID=UPI000B519FEC|nr:MULTISPECIES: FecR domain-containing protein [unclassified Achromobacter]OWT70325.1 hypothetical protein CEY05_27225 [Achromobacter sp. HZ34]OWT71865.1 hypothetical protein CEY04_26060 [Achromobacter sp. HZ28]
MNANADIQGDDGIRERAAYWLTRIHSGEATHAEVDACAAWRRADPAHDRMYRSMDYVWRASQHLPEQQLRALLDSSGAAMPADRASDTVTGGAAGQRPAKAEAKAITHASWSRRRFAYGAGAVSAAAVAAALLPNLRSDPAQYEATFETALGERRQIALPDDSVVDLNGKTHLRVALYGDRREVELLAGEAFFSVRRDTARPFTVQAGEALVTVTGTRFDVRRDAASVDVSVESGSVNVAAGPWWHRRRRDLVADQAVRVGTDRRISDVTRVTTQNLTAWREGKIVFKDAPLVLVVAEVNRYLALPAQFDAAPLADFRIAGVFNLDAPQAVLEALPAIAPVRVLRLPNGALRIVAAR